MQNQCLMEMVGNVFASIHLLTPVNVLEFVYVHGLIFKLGMKRVMLRFGKELLQLQVILVWKKWMMILVNFLLILDQMKRYVMMGACLLVHILVLVRIMRRHVWTLYVLHSRLVPLR